MRSLIPIIAGLALAAVTGNAAHAQATWSGDQETAWGRFVAADAPDALLEAVAELAPWPATRSSKAATAGGMGEETAAEGRRRQFAKPLLQRLGTLRTTLRQSTDAELGATIKGLVALRRALARETGYVNLLIADAVSRTLVAETARRLVAGSATASRPEIMTALRDYRLDVRALVAVAEAELGPALAFEAGPTTEIPVRTLARLIEAVTGDIEMAFAPLADLESTGVLALLERPDVGKLLSRLWLTDQRLHVALPVLAAYAAAIPGQPIEADIEAIGRAVDLKSLSRGHYGTPLSRATPMAVYDVAGLIRAVRDGRIELFAALDLS